MSDLNYEPVVFLNASGEEVSNDPNWLAMKQLQAAGISFNQSQPGHLESVLQAANRPAPAEDDEDIDDGEPEEALDEAGNRTYAELSGKALVSLADERGVERKGLKKVGELRAALIQADADARDDEGDDE